MGCSEAEMIFLGCLKISWTSGIGIDFENGLMAFSLETVLILQDQEISWFAYLLSAPPGPATLPYFYLGLMSSPRVYSVPFRFVGNHKTKSHSDEHTSPEGLSVLKGKGHVM